MEQIDLVQGAVNASTSRLNAGLDFVNQAQINADFAALKITDIDIASDVAELTKLNVVQNTATAMLASANQNIGLVQTLLQAD